MVDPPQWYGAIPQKGRPGKKGRGMAIVALAGLAAVACIGAIASQKYIHASSPVALAAPGWFSAIEDQFSDDSTSTKDKAIRMQLAAGEAVVKPVLPKGSITTAGYTDGLTGTRLDKLTAAGDRYVQDKKPQASLLARHGVEMEFSANLEVEAYMQSYAFRTAEHKQRIAAYRDRVKKKGT